MLGTPLFATCASFATCVTFNPSLPTRRAETLSTLHTIHRIGSFAGLNNSGWDLRVLQDVTNAGVILDGRGRTLGNGRHQTFKVTATELNRVRSQPGLYEISGYRPMLNSTRELISRREHDACHTLHREFGIAIGCRLVSPGTS